MICRRSLGLQLVVLALATLPAPALASSQDVASTHAAIVAGYALARVAVATIPVAQSRIESFNRKLAMDCPNAGAGAPETEAAWPISHEVAVALWSIAYGSASGAIERFARAIEPLYWTNARLDRAVHSFAAALTRLATIGLPDLCGEVRAWAATGFTSVPRRVTELDEHVESLELPEIPWTLVAPYVRGRDGRLVAYIRRAEMKVAEAEFMLGQKDWYQVLETLGVPA
jgi:hypothetical protein